MIQTRRRLPRHGHAVDSFRRLLPQILANEACATKDSDRWMLIPQGSKRRETAVGGAAAPNRSTGQLYMRDTSLKDLRRLAHR
jgi:hypothetical protein